MKLNTILFFCAVLGLGCGQASDKTITADAIAIPMTSDGKIDTAKLPKMEFEQEIYDFGKIEEGEKVAFSFRLKNTGSTPLVISNASASCGCTVPKKPEDPIAPGENATIDIVFNSEGKIGLQNKTVTITANTVPNTKILYLRGEVVAAQ